VLQGAAAAGDVALVPLMDLLGLLFVAVCCRALLLVVVWLLHWSCSR
jgi:hypothetical protein